MTLAEITKAFKLLGFLMATTDYKDGLVDPCDMHNIMMLMNRGVESWMRETTSVVGRYEGISIPCGSKISDLPVSGNLKDMNIEIYGNTDE